MDVLADKLDRALPGRVKVQRRAGRLLSKQKHATAIELDLGETRYLLTARDGAVETRCATAVRGIDYFNNPQGRSYVFSVTLNR